MNEKTCELIKITRRHVRRTRRHIKITRRIK